MLKIYSACSLEDISDKTFEKVSILGTDSLETKLLHVIEGSTIT